MGHRVVVLESDLIVTGDQHLEVGVRDGSSSITLGNETFSASDIAAAWWRKPGLLMVARSDPLARHALERESRALLEWVLDLVPDDAWLNSRVAARRASSFLQLLEANRVGFTTPWTVVTNSWKGVTALAKAGDLIIKLPNGTLESQKSPKSLFTTRISPQSIAELSKSSKAFPAVWQPFVSKLREWRVTVVGDQVFEAMIETDDQAKDDWRRHQFTAGVRFVQGTLPAAVRERCRRVVQQLGLRFGAIDLIESPSGEFTFLEVNPNGQYYWLEALLGMEISSAVAQQISRLATARAN